MQRFMPGRLTGFRRVDEVARTFRNGFGADPFRFM